MPDELHAADALDALIDAVAAAPCGSRELDVRLDYAIGVMHAGRVDLATTMIREGITWQTVSAVLDSRVPAYTTSLDAVIEGENIVFSIRSDKRAQWGAMHRARRGKELLVWAATEPLARRLAALNGLRADAEHDRAAQGEAAAVTHPAAPSATGGSEPRFAVAGGGVGDWKILF